MYHTIKATTIATRPWETINGGWNPLLKMILLALSHLNKTKDIDIILFPLRVLQWGRRSSLRIPIGWAESRGGANAISTKWSAQTSTHSRAFVFSISFFLVLWLPWQFLTTTVLCIILQCVRRLSCKFWRRYTVVIAVSLAWFFVKKSEQWKNGVALRLAALTHQRFETPRGCKFDSYTMTLTYMQMRV